MKKPALIISLVILFIVAIQSCYILEQTKQSIEIRFGKVVDTEQEPGLKFKMPFVDVVHIFDVRLLNFSADSKEVIAADKKRLIVDAFAKYRITDPVKFYQSVRTEAAGRNLLDRDIESSLRQVIGSIELSSLLLEGERAKIMEEIRNIVNQKAKSFGVSVSDVRIMRADLPEKNSSAIYRRMQTEREREAKEFRAEGEEEAKKITSKADRETIEILAQSKKESEIIRGRADAKATRIFAKALNQDPNFYEFYRSLEAYKNSVSDDSTSIIISPDSRFLRYLKDMYR